MTPRVLLLLALAIPAFADAMNPWPEVNVKNANLVVTKPELKLYWAGPPLELKRVYNSRRRDAGPAGYGWRLTYSRQLSVVTEGVAILEDDGAITRYRGAKGAARYEPVLGASYHFVEKQKDGRFRRTREGIYETYGADGKLAELADANGMAITVMQGPGGLAGLKDSTGRTIAFTTDAKGRIVAIVDPILRKTAYTYDDAGNLASATDVLGGTTQYRYDAAHHLTDVTYPGGETAKIAYDPLSDWVQTVELPGGRKLAYKYQPDPADRGRYAVDVTDDTGAKTVYRYSREARDLEITGPSGEITRQTECDACGGFVTIANPIGGTLTHKHSPDGLAFEATDAAGGTEKLTYEPKFHRVATRTDKVGGVTTYSYDERGNLIGTQDPLKQKSMCPRDRRGFVNGLVRPDGTKIEIENNAQGQPVKIKDGLNGLTTLEYDGVGRPTAVTDPDMRTTQVKYNAADAAQVVSESGGPRKAVEFDTAGRVTAEADRDGHRTTYAYGPQGKPVKVTSPAGAETAFAYDTRGNVSEVTRDGGGKFSFKYDASSRPVEVADPEGGKLKVTWDAGANMTRLEDGTGAQSKFRYDSSGRLIRNEDPTGRAWSFQYDGEGRITSIAQPNQQSITAVYDPLGRLVTMRRPMDAKDEYKYSPLSKPVEHVDAAGNKTSWTYDADGRATEVADPVFGKVGYAYTPAGRLKEVKWAGDKWIKIGYDDKQRTRKVEASSGEVIETRLGWDGARLEEKGPGYHVKWQYTDDGHVSEMADALADKVQRYRTDPLGNRTRWTDPDGRETVYKLDGAGRLVGISDRLGFNVKLVYDAAGRRTQREVDLGLITTYAYDEAGRLTSLAHAFKGKSVLRWILSYSPDGAISRIEEGGSATTYALDALDRVKQVTPPSGTAAVMAYDALGNLSASGTPTTTSEPRTLTRAGQVVAMSDRAVAYDDQGGVSNEGTGGGGAYGYRYDGLTRLVGAATPDGSNVELKYGPDLLWAGLSTGKDGLQLAYDGERVVAEKSLDGKVLAEYGHGPGLDEPLVMKRDGKMYLLLADHLGTIRRMLDESGAVVRAMDVSLHGKPVKDEGVSCLFGFTGRPRESNTGLVNLRMRWYNPRLAAFQTLDPVVPASRYNYCGGNPVTFVDPIGAAGGTWLSSGPFAQTASLASLKAGLALTGAAGTAALDAFASATRGHGSVAAVTRGLVRAAAGAGTGWTLAAPPQVPSGTTAPAGAGSSGALAEAASGAVAFGARLDPARLLLSASSSALSRGMYVGIGQLISMRIQAQVGAPGPLTPDLTLGIPDVVAGAMGEMSMVHVAPGGGGSRPACEHTR